MIVTIRPERPEDFPAIRELVRLAFETAEHADGDEHNLVDRLRLTPDYIPELTLVAEISDQNGNGQILGKIVGHIMFTKLHVGDNTALSLAPLSVLPGFQGKGIGGALIRRGHELARALGWQFIVLMGHAAYYPRFGYLPAKSFGMTLALDVPDEAFMAVNLAGNNDRLPGAVNYSKAFFPNPSACDPS